MSNLCKAHIQESNQPEFACDICKLQDALSELLEVLPILTYYRGSVFCEYCEAGAATPDAIQHERDCTIARARELL